MKLWLLSQTERQGYDTYDSAVVAAETEEEARLIHPDQWEDNPWEETEYNDVWATKPEQVSVMLIGEATPNVLPGIILTSFNAG